MADKCIICEDPRREEIEKLLSGQRAISKASRQFGYSRATIAKHRLHIVRKPTLELPSDPGADEIARMKAEVQRIINDTDDEKVRIAALRELRGYLELEIRVQQESGASSALTADPAFQRLAAALAGSLCTDCRANIDVLTADMLSVAHLHSAAATTESDADGSSDPLGGVPAGDPDPPGGRSP